MDTKWKNRKKGISFMIYFAGVSLTLGGGLGLLQNLPGDFWENPKMVLQEDYQQSWRFRQYISNRLEEFLAMATNSYDGCYNNYYDSYGYLYSGDTAWSVTENVTITPVQPLIPEELQEGMTDEELEEFYAREYGLSRDYLENYGWDDYEQDEEGWHNRTDPLTEEQREERYRKIAQRYHDSIKGDQNLLYSIAYDGQLLYANSELLPTDGSMTAPEGYNFLLQYAEGKVRIFKDGKEMDVYGDGYYRNDNEWYVPGYRNFMVDDKMKKAVIYIATAQDPVLYTRSSYANGSYREMDNSLYWLQYNLTQNRKWVIRYTVLLSMGLVLLIMAFLCRKSRREANAAIARFTGKIWFEGKILICLLVLYPLFLLCVTWINYHYWDFMYEPWSWPEMIINYNLIPQVIYNLPGWAWFILFWLVYLIVLDLRHNRKVWKHGLIAKLHRNFTARNLQQPLSVKAAHRNTAAFVTATVFGVLMLGGGILGYVQRYHNTETVWGMGSLFFLILVGFLILQYRIGVKNMEIARDLETLSDRIMDIRNGNYSSPNTLSGTTEDLYNKNTSMTGHDLEDTMAQLEDIRHGMVKAVDEQMKSERMKVELIANVSHDIKTPLTSIISYVQFLKEEKELPEYVQDYIKILDEKSQRLKNMVQDVFSVSKAASGELPVHMEELDFSKLLRQTLADMEEQINSSNVTFRTEIPDSPVMIMADGQRMYRVFQNLFQNALQYSLDGSRVFVTLQTHGQLAVASVKNTSHMELEKNKDFTERFARGDQSRTDGGSGLGLSIAQSFTGACGGSFSWETNADLFVVTVSFQVIGN